MASLHTKQSKQNFYSINYHNISHFQKVPKENMNLASLGRENTNKICLGEKNFLQEHILITLISLSYTYLFMSIIFISTLPHFKKNCYEI